MSSTPGQVPTMIPQHIKLAPVWTIRATRLCAQIGLVVLVVGAGSINRPDGVLFVLIGAGLLAIYAWMRVRSSQVHRQDVDAGRYLADSLRSGNRPSPVVPEALGAAGVRLEPGETCFVDGAKVEIMQWYGDPVVLTRRFFFVWGSPLAWTFSILAIFGSWQHNRKKAKKAAPRWRDPEDAQLWVTDRRFLLHGRSGNQSWVQIRWQSIHQALLDKDGVVLLLDENEHRPMKIRTGTAAWIFVLYQFASRRQIFLPQRHRWSRALASAP